MKIKIRNFNYSQIVSQHTKSISKVIPLTPWSEHEIGSIPQHGLDPEPETGIKETAYFLDIPLGERRAASSIGVCFVDDRKQELIERVVPLQFAAAIVAAMTLSHPAPQQTH